MAHSAAVSEHPDFTSGGSAVRTRVCPYSCETISSTYAGYTCLVSEDFLRPSERSESLLQSPLFNIGGTPVLHITDQQRKFLNSFFQKMMDEQQAHYAFKDDLIRNYIHLIIHEVLKMQPSENYTFNTNAASRLTNVSLELLTDRNIADIAYALGFEYPAYFNNFFKRVTGTNPKSMRILEV